MPLTEEPTGELLINPAKAELEHKYNGIEPPPPALGLVPALPRVLRFIRIMGALIRRTKPILLHLLTSQKHFLRNVSGVSQSFPRSRAYQLAPSIDNRTRRRELAG